MEVEGAQAGQTLTETAMGLALFNIARFRFTAIANSEIQFSAHKAPAYKGSTFHGGFGHALNHVSPTFYRYFYPPAGAGDPPKPFVVTPPLEEKPAYAPGERLQFELGLFGAATQHFPICFGAFEALGQHLGLGRNNGRYTIEQVEYFSAAGQPQLLYRQGQWRFAQHTVTGQAIAAAGSAVTCRRITLQLQTRLRLKDNGRIVSHGPAFSQLLDRLLGRLHTLATFHQGSELLPRPERNRLLAHAEEVQTEHANVRWDDWQRYSERQKESMKFGGLLGEITYAGELDPFMPYLRLGEWVHLGGKTSFGLGKYVLNSS